VIITHLAQKSHKYQLNIQITNIKLVYKYYFFISFCFSNIYAIFALNVLLSHPNKYWKIDFQIIATISHAKAIPILLNLPYASIFDCRGRLTNACGLGGLVKAHSMLG